MNRQDFELMYHHRSEMGGLDLSLPLGSTHLQQPALAVTVDDKLMDMSSPNIPFSTIQSLFHLPIVEAAQKCGMCTTAFKKACRKNNVYKWPFRQVMSLRNEIDALQKMLDNNLPSNAERAATLQNQIQESQKNLDRLTQHPDFLQIEKLQKKRDLASSLAKKHGYKINALVGGNILLGQHGIMVADSDMFDDHCSQTTAALMNAAANNALHELEDPNSATAAPAANNNIRVMSSESSYSSRHKRARDSSSYNFNTGWVAECSKCGRIGKFRSPQEGRPFQHSNGQGKYCGYFRNNPRMMDADDSMHLGIPHIDVRGMPSSILFSEELVIQQLQDQSVYSSTQII